ncbi:MAG: anaerobic sulfatase maturase [Bacteroidales bacterium]|nr:anaerobic sulfatase maturase [Bacteroidales bacterium]MDD4292420.1 anaerobic sulfatase maturase [Bacteroidales bacterium]MDD4491503.1 anaerobic sulfatase maturase [Bacteroidales bacterium]
MKPQGSNTLHINEAYRFQPGKPFSLMLKPVGAECNLNCAYCYYMPAEPENSRPGRLIIMSEELLRNAIFETIRLNNTPEVSFCWHGGEPLLAGIGFFQKAVEIQQEALAQENLKYSGSKTIINTIQTNGTLINAEWCRFFKQNNFLVGVSIDGPKDIHDAFRVNRAGESMFDRTMSGISMLKEWGVEFNTLSTVNSASEGRGAVVYEFLKSIGANSHENPRFMQFLPVVAPDEVWGVSAEGYGQFMKDVFSEWWRCEDAGRVYVQLFDVALANYMGMQGGLCQFNPVCGDVPVLELNGDIFTCDHFVNRPESDVDNDFYLGNLKKQNFEELVYSPKIANFGIEKRSRLPVKCQRCDYLNLCFGGCPEHRVVKTEGDNNINFLCPGYVSFFSFVSPYLEIISKNINSNFT